MDINNNYFKEGLYQGYDWTKNQHIEHNCIILNKEKLLKMKQNIINNYKNKTLPENLQIACNFCCKRINIIEYNV